MLHHPEKVMPVLQTLAKDINLGKEVTEVHYRDDYQDYLVILDDNFHTEIREKLMDDYMKSQMGDFKREIVFRLKHAVEYEEWERLDEKAAGDGEDKVEVDDSDKYDI